MQCLAVKRSQLVQRLISTHPTRSTEEAGRRPRSPSAASPPQGNRAPTGEGGRETGSSAADARRWAETCFAAGAPSSKEQIETLIQEASEAARDDYGEDSARAWAGGYQFPAEYVQSDVSFLRSQMLDFKSMVRRRLLQLSHDRLSKERVGRLRADNPERVLMFELVDGMKVHRPEGFS